MPKNYYVSDIIGDGTEENPFRPAVADKGVAWAASIPTHPLGHPNAGKPINTACLAIVNAANHAPLRAAAGIDPLPDFPLDGKVSAINLLTRGRMKAALERRGLNADAVVDGKDGYREVVRAVGKHFDVAFDENNFDVE